MGLIQNIVRKIREKKKEQTAEERRQAILENIETKKLSANERELNGYLEKERQEKIKKILDGYHRRMQDKLWGGKDGNPAYVPNIIKQKKNIFSNNGSLFTKKRSRIFENKSFLYKR